MPDKILTCRECGVNFTFTTSEQDFYTSKGFANQPGRCPDCRRARKATQDIGYGGGYERREQQMFPAVCAQCGKDTEVLFQPTGERPVYCSTCFQEHRTQTGSGRNRDYSTRSWGYLGDLLGSRQYRS